MNSNITKEQIEQYQNDGVVVHRGLLEAAEVAELKAAVLEAIDSMGKKKVIGGRHLDEDGDSYYDKVFTQKLNLWRIHPTVKKFMIDGPLGQMITTLTGNEGFRVWHDQALIKEPNGNPTAWHLDNPYWSFYSKQSISVWIALEESTLQNGAMCFLPGSQKCASYKNVDIGPDLGGLTKAYPEMAKIDPIAVPMKPGDCSFHNGLTGHGAGANMTRGRRIAMTCAFMPIGSTFNGQQNILHNDYFKGLKVGDVLENDDWNPIVYQR
jgi:phytanoyl-CoA hydroxylase